MFDEGDKNTIKLTVSEAVAPLVDKLNEHHTSITIAEKDVKSLDGRVEKAEGWQETHLETKHSALKTVRNIGIIAGAIVLTGAAVGVIVGFASCIQQGGL